MGTEYEHCQNCGYPTTSDTGYCRDCNPAENRIIINMGKKREALVNLRYLAACQHIRPSQYILELVEADIKTQIEKINRRMKGLPE